MLALRARYQALLIAPVAEVAAPGRIAEFQARYHSRRLAGLREEACRAIERLPG